MLGSLKRLLGWTWGDDAGFAGALTGTYDLYGDTIRGVVEFELPDSRRGLEVQALRYGNPIAACPVEPGGGGSKLRFELPMLGRFTAADLAHETVIIAARNPRGDSGTLGLEGSTRLELIRTYLGVPAETIIDLDFTRHGNARPFLGKGWSNAEDTFTWTEDDDSFIHFRTPAAPGPFLLRMRLVASIAAFVPIQLMQIHLNEAVVATFTESDPAEQFREFRLTGESFAGTTESHLRLHHPYAVRPRDHHASSTDGRRLAFRVKRLSLVRVLNPND